MSKAFLSQLILNPCTSQIQNLLFILPVNNVKQEFVENDFWNPDWYLYKILFLFKKILV